MFNWTMPNMTEFTQNAAITIALYISRWCTFYTIIQDDEKSLHDIYEIIDKYYLNYYCAPILAYFKIH